LAPLPFGSTDAVVVCVESIALGFALGLAKADARQPVAWWLIAFLLAIPCTYLIVIAFQLNLAGWGRSHIFPVWDHAGALLGNSLDGVPAVAKGQQYWALLNPLVSLLAITSSYLLCWDRDRAHRLLLVIGIAGLFYAAIGMLFFLFFPDLVLWRKKTGHIGYLTATFLNRNTAAVYFGGCGLVWLLLGLQRIKAYLPGRDLRALPSFFHVVPRRAFYPMGAMVFCIQAMLFTGSRAGILLGLFSCGASLVALRWHKVTKGALLTFVLAFALVAVLLVQTVGVDRFRQEGLSDYSRLATYRATIEMISQRPLFGWGLGTFAWAYPPNRSPDASIIGVWDRAHNSWLELAAEGGLPLATLVGTFWLYICYRLARGTAERRRDRYIPAAAFGFVALGICHSLIDFSIQIPGFAIVLSAVAGAGLAQSVPRSRRRALLGN
jgi:O-antigen ligase